LVVLQARDPAEALRLKAVKLAVIRRGRVIARTPARVGELLIDGRRGLVDPSIGFAPDY
jgi:cytosine deaminase